MSVDPKSQHQTMLQTSNKLIEGFEENYKNNLNDKQRKLLKDFTMFIYTIQTEKELAHKLINKNRSFNGQQ